MDSFENALPVEQWQQILEKVEPTDLRNVTLTSRHMNSMASLPELWAEMKVNVEKVRDNGLAELFAIHRFKKIKRIHFTGDNFTSEELNNIIDDIPEFPLEDINWNYVNLSGVPAYKLAKTVGQLHTINLEGTSLSTDQCSQMLVASLSSTTLVDVSLFNVNLSEVPLDLLARAICRLKTADLSCTDMTTDQCVQVLDTSLSSTTLVDVNLSYLNLSGVPAYLLARAICRLKTADLSFTDMTTDQGIQVLDTSLSSTTLEDVNLNFVDLSGVPARLLASAVSRLRSVHLIYSRMTIDQRNEVYRASLSSATLKSSSFDEKYLPTCQ